MPKIKSLEQVRGKVPVTGQRSMLMRKLSGCSNCPIRSSCPIKDTLSLEEQKRGCKEVYTTYIQYLRELRYPVAFIAKQLAELQTEIDMLKYLDGKEQELLSDKKLKALSLMAQMLKTMHQMGFGEMKTVKHIIEDRKNPEKVIEVDFYPLKNETKPNEENDSGDNPSEY